MQNNPDHSTLHPLGRRFTLLGKNYLQLLNAKLNFLDIERYYYTILLIEQGNGCITQNELASRLETDKVSVVRIIDYLTLKGYVERIRSSSDKRKYSLTLSDKAIKAIPGIKQAIFDTTNYALNGLSEEQKTDFFTTLEIIKTNLKIANNPGI